MDFALSEEQRMLQESVSRFLTSNCTLDQVRGVAESGAARDDTLWQELTNLGVHGVLIAEEYGGVGLGYLEAALIAEALGATTTPVPFVGNAIISAVALQAAGGEAQKDDWLPRIAAGEVVMGAGLTEQVGARESDGIVAVDGKLTGKAMFVLDAGAADAFLIGADDGSLHIVDAANVTVTTLKTIDRTRNVGEIVLDGVAGDVLPGSVGNAEPLRTAIDIGRLILAADTLGAAQTMLEKSIEYAKERRQFNRVIGSFQAVKHMCAEMAAELEPTRSLIWYAAHAYSAMPEEGRAMAGHAKAHLAEVGQFVARQSTEVHGGMGITDLLGLHYWFKRIGFNRQLLGTPELVREEVAAAQGLGLTEPIETARLVIERADQSHAQALTAYYADNAEHLAPWEPLKPAGFNDLDQWQSRLVEWEHEAALGNNYRFVASTHEHPQSIVAFCALTNVSRGVFQACNLGYSIGVRYEGHGYMTEMVAAVVDHAFNELNLHRVMANYMPENERSGAVLERLGFEREGFAKRYLQIAGVWRDHVLTAKVRTDD